ncbi:hypothetical protein L3Q82_007070 [Scortum barcoo]|uniref:Uncharacterized protein n=1 Tax=Scortum barcoo TaxID=214431 RepID=A0ACB8WT03_9TELE|nr:hypothetical protein L3Q82_007070 [Scortum barcoo]
MCECSQVSLKQKMLHSQFSLWVFTQRVNNVPLLPAICVEGYYGNPVSRQPCQPCLCPDVQSSGRFFATSCLHDPQSLSLTCNCRKGHTGPRCDRCRPGFYGNLALPGASCEECPCNNNIDLDNQNACDGLTGQCLRCLHNTMGPHCQDCKPGYYGNALNQDCKECSCDRRGTEATQCPLASPCICDSRTGQCPCRRGVVGVFCDECEDGYWNLDGASGCQPCSCDPVNSASNICNKARPPTSQSCSEYAEFPCSACDCNMEGTERSCDPETGECMCRIGVTGIFCDECAPGYDSAFPACKPCHPCTVLWAQNITDVQRAAQRMRSFLPHHGEDLQPEDGQHQRMLEMHSKLDSLSNLTGLSPPKVEKVEKLCLMIKKLKDAIDPNVILTDPSPLLNTEIDNIRLEFKKLFNNLKILVEDPEDEDEFPEEQLDEIQKLHKAFMSDEKRVRNANKALEDSMDTRQEVKHKLSMCSSSGDLAPLEKKMKDLSMVSLNQQINDAKQAAEDTKDQAKGLQDRITDNMDSFERDKNKTKELIQRVKDYLMDEMVPPEDIEKMARAVLDIQLPRSPDQIQSMINNINNLLSNATNFQDDLKNLEMQAKTAQDLLQRAREIKERTKSTDVTEISRDIYEAEKVQNKANDDLETASRDRDPTRDRVQDIKDKLDDMETKLLNRRPDLTEDIEALKKKTDQNREMARDTREAADSVLKNTADTETEMDSVVQLFEHLKEENLNQTEQGEAKERLKNIVEEAAKMKKQVEDKLRQIQDLEKKIQQLIRSKEDKAAEVTMLLETVDSLRKEISKRADGYTACTS